MTKRWIFIGSMSFLSLTGFAQQYTTTIQLTPGNTIHSQTSTSSKMNRSTPQGNMDMTTETVIASELQVLDKKNEQYTLESKVQKIHSIFNGFGQSMEYDSEDPSKQKGMMAEPFNKMIEEKDTLFFNEQGEMEKKPKKEEKKGGGMMAMMKNQAGGMENTFLILPPEVKEGMGWKVTKEEENIRTQTIYTLDSLKGKTAYVHGKRKSVGTVKFDNGGFSGETSFDAMSSIQITVNIQTGLVMHYLEERKDTSNTKMGENEMPSSGTTTIETTYELNE